MYSQLTETTLLSVQHLAPVIEAVSDASADALEDLADDIDDSNESSSFKESIFIANLENSIVNN